MTTGPGRKPQAGTDQKLAERFERALSVREFALLHGWPLPPQPERFKWRRCLLVVLGALLATLLLGRLLESLRVADQRPPAVPHGSVTNTCPGERKAFSIAVGLAAIGGGRLGSGHHPRSYGRLYRWRHDKGVNRREAIAPCPRCVDRRTREFSSIWPTELPLAMKLLPAMPECCFKSIRMPGCAARSATYVDRILK
jgi:hypothetical protein